MNQKSRQDNSFLPHGLSRSLSCGLLAHNRLAHNSILTSHSAAERAFHLGTNGQLVEAFGLLSGGDETLLLEGLVFETLEAVANVVDFSQAGVTAGQATVGGNGSGSTDSGESLGGTVLIYIS